MKVNLAANPAIVTDITSQVLKGDGYNEITAFEYTLPESNDMGRLEANSALAIGTFNSSLGKDEGGRLEFFSSNPTSGDLTLAKFPDEPTVPAEPEECEEPEEPYQIKMSWEGMGRIVGINFKKR
jgi:hypothetical protein